MNPNYSKMRTISLVQKKAKPGNNETLVFNFEGTLLRSTSLFPYFMLVAFEAGGVLRSLILFLSYPLVWLVGEDQLGLKIMVFLSFFGLRKDTFRTGSAVLPKFFLEDVGWEGFEAAMCCEKKVASSKLPRVMVENFLKDYLGVDAVIARELKSFSGFFLGVFESKKPIKIPSYKVNGGTKEGNINNNNSIGIIDNHVEYIDQEELFQQFKVWSFLKYIKDSIIHVQTHVVMPFNIKKKTFQVLFNLNNCLLTTVLFFCAGVLHN